MFCQLFFLQIRTSSASNVLIPLTISGMRTREISPVGSVRITVNVTHAISGIAHFKSGFIYFEKISTGLDFLINMKQYGWRTVCKTCRQSFVVANSTCFSCSSLIPYCDNCYFKENSNSISNLSCSSCSNGKVVQFSSNYLPSSCSPCSIENCRQCAYAAKIMSTLKFIFSIDPLDIHYQNPAYNIEITCYECINGYGFGDQNQKTCLKCPPNCETCYVKRGSLLCGRCAKNFVLNLFAGTCHQRSEYPNITSSFSSQCEKMVSENPWRD